MVTLVTMCKNRIARIATRTLKTLQIPWRDTLAIFLVASPPYSVETDRMRGFFRGLCNSTNGPSPQPSPPSTGERESVPQ